MRNVKHLKVVFLTDSTKFPIEIFELSGLKEFVSIGTLCEIPSEIIKASQLESIVIRNNSCLNELPKELFSLTNLTKLEINGKNMTTIYNDKSTLYCSNFSKLKKLKILKLSNVDINYNDLREIGEITDLEDLSLITCNLKMLPSNFGNFKKMNRLNLTGNRLFKIPEQFNNLVSLEILVLQDNSINDFSFDIGKLQNLKYLNIEFNQIRQLPEEIRQLKKLMKLNLRMCGITNDFSSIIPFGQKEISIIDSVQIYTVNDSIFTELDFKNCITNISTLTSENMQVVKENDESSSYLHTQPTERVIKALEKLKTEYPNNLKFLVDSKQAYCDFAWGLLEYGEFGGALEQINIGLNIYKDNKTLQLYYPIALYCNGNIDIAKIEFEKNKNQIYSQNKNEKVTFYKILLEKLTQLLESENLTDANKTQIKNLISELKH